MTDRRRDLASFDDRYTLRYVRIYTASIERVWRAVTTSEELDIWLYPVSRVEPRLGGRVSFTWGKPEHEPQSGEVTIFEPPRRIRYQWRERTGYLEFVLEPLPDGTRLSFIDHFEADFRQDQSRVDPSDKAASLPAGPDTPWRPGFVAGFHLNLAALGQFVCEDWSAEQIRVRSQRGCDIANGKLEGSFESGPDSDWSELVEVYYEHIQKSCPAATE